jgi:hypothetical protein
MTATTTYEADDTALLIVDPYNDFMGPLSFFSRVVSRPLQASHR